MIRMSCFTCGHMFAVEDYAPGKRRYMCRGCRGGRSPKADNPIIRLHSGYWECHSRPGCPKEKSEAAHQFVLAKNFKEGRYPGCLSA